MRNVVWNEIERTAAGQRSRDESCSVLKWFEISDDGCYSPRRSLPIVLEREKKVKKHRRARLQHVPVVGRRGGDLVERRRPAPDVVEVDVVLHHERALVPRAQRGNAAQDV